MAPVIPFRSICKRSQTALGVGGPSLIRRLTKLDRLLVGGEIAKEIGKPKAAKACAVDYVCELIRLKFPQAEVARVTVALNVTNDEVNERQNRKKGMINSAIRPGRGTISGTLAVKAVVSLYSYAFTTDNISSGVIPLDAPGYTREPFSHGIQCLLLAHKIASKNDVAGFEQRIFRQLVRLYSLYPRTVAPLVTEPLLSKVKDAVYLQKEMAGMNLSPAGFSEFLDSLPSSLKAELTAMRDLLERVSPKPKFLLD